MIEMRTNNNRLRCATGKNTDNIRLLAIGDRLFGEVLRRTTRLPEKLHQRGFALCVVTFVESDPLLHRFLRYNVIVKLRQNAGCK